MARVRASLVRGEVVRLPGATRSARRCGTRSPPASRCRSPISSRRWSSQKGAAVLILLDTPGLTLTAQGQALEAGAVGERIRVLNPGIARGGRGGSDRSRPGAGRAAIAVPAARAKTQVAAQ